MSQIQGQIKCFLKIILKKAPLGFKIIVYEMWPTVHSIGLCCRLCFNHRVSRARSCSQRLFLNFRILEKDHKHRSCEGAFFLLSILNSSLGGWLCSSISSPSVAEFSISILVSGLIVGGWAGRRLLTGKTGSLARKWHDESVWYPVSLCIFSF